MSLKYLLDTSTISATIAAKPNRTAVQRLTQRGAQCAIASVVWNELLYGCARLEGGNRKTELEAYLRGVVAPSFPILAYDEEAAKWHAHERVRRERLGRPAPYVDSQIAAVACVHGLILVTANVKDFSGFKDLVVEDWTKARAK